MQVKNDIFSIQVTGNQEILNSDNSFDSFKLITKIGAWPVFQLAMKVKNWSSLVGEKKLKIKLCIFDNRNYNFDATIMKMDIEKDFVRFIGMIGQPEYLFESQSQYLGTDFKGAVNKLASIFNMQYKHGFTYSDEDGFYMMNETPKNALMKVLASSGNDYIYFIDVDSCNLINPSEAKLNESFKTIETMGIQLSDNYHHINTIKSNSGFSEYKQANIHEVTDENYYRTKDPSKIHDHYEFKGVKSYMYNREINKNTLAGMLFTEGFHLRTVYHQKKYMNVEVGDLIKFPMDEVTDKFLVVGKEINLDLTTVKTILELGHYIEEFK